MPPSDSRTEVRRRDRAVRDEAWMKQMLATAATGVLATVEDGQPFLNANLFVYDESRHALYFHTARRGQTRTHLEEPARVAFTVMEMGRLLPADTALEFSTEYASVMAFGRGALVPDATEAQAALQLLLDKYFADLTPGEDYQHITPEELKRTSVFRVDIEEWVGKRKRVEEGFPGARWYQPVSMLTPETDPPAEDG